MTIAIFRCPRHARFWAIAVNDRWITPSKCCGGWSKVVQWKIDELSFAVASSLAIRGGRV